MHLRLYSSVNQHIRHSFKVKTMRNFLFLPLSSKFHSQILQHSREQASFSFSPLSLFPSSSSTLITEFPLCLKCLFFSFILTSADSHIQRQNQQLCCLLKIILMTRHSTLLLHISSHKLKRSCLGCEAGTWDVNSLHVQAAYNLQCFPEQKPECWGLGRRQRSPALTGGARQRKGNKFMGDWARGDAGSGSGGGGRMTHKGRYKRKKQKQSRLSDLSRSWQGRPTVRVRKRDKERWICRGGDKDEGGGMSCVCRVSLGGEIVH